MFWKWIIPLFGGEAAGGVTALHRLAVTSWLPLWLLPFLVAGLAAFCWWRYRTLHPELARRRRALLVTLRTLAYVALLGMLLLPTLHIEGEAIQPGTVPVVLDATQSMTIHDAAGGQERFTAARRFATELREEGRKSRHELAPAFFLYRNGLADLPAEGEVTADGDPTSLSQMLEKAAERIQDRYCPGILLLTDGAHNTVELPERTAEALKKRNIPIYAVGFGAETTRDLAVTGIIGEDVLFQEEKAQAYVSVRASGYAGQPVKLALYLDDSPLSVQEVKLAADGEATLPVEFTPRQPGRFRLRAELAPQAGEVTAVNNRFLKNVRVINEKIRVLLVFGKPSWEFRYLAGAFERDRRVELKLFLGALDRRGLQAPSQRGRYLEKLPATAEEINRQFDLLILSRFHPLRDAPATFAQAVAGYVRDHAGGLVVLSDPELLPYAMRGTPLEELLPVTLAPTAGRGYTDELLAPLKDGYSLALTEEGVLSPLMNFAGDRAENLRTWTKLPPLHYLYRPLRTKPSAITLLEAARRGGIEKRPALVHHLYGKGPVLFLGFDATWRWRREYGDRYFRDFWAKSVQFVGLPHLLGESTRSQLYTATENVTVGEIVGLRARLHNPDMTPYVAEAITATAVENGVERTVRMAPVPDRPGLYKAEWLPTAVGTLRVALPPTFGAPPLELRVTAVQREFQAPGLHRALLESLCAATGGRYFARPDAAAAWRQIRENRPPLPFTLDFSLWDTWGLLLLALTLFALEWLARKLYFLD